MADSDLEEYLKADSKRGFDTHPLIRLLTDRQGTPDFGAARVNILRPRATLGFEPARLTLEFFDKSGKLSDYKIEEWDAGLNTALIRHKIKAIDEANEIQRFSLGLSDGFGEAEGRYGDGFFNSVLMTVIDEGPFGKKAPIQALRSKISTNKPYQGGNSAGDCAAMIQSALQDRWFELRRDLGYDQAPADRILASALANFLDERFTITDRQKLGW